MADFSRAIRTWADQLLIRIEAAGDSAELRIAKARVEEAVIWADRHFAAQTTGRNMPPNIRRLILDIFDRIAAAIAAKNSGDLSALQQHVTAIDGHLSQLDTEDADEKTRVSNIEAGLDKIANVVNPPPSLTVSPATLSATAGQGFTGSISVTGGTSPYSFSSSLSDLSVDASGNVSGTPSVAEDGKITVSDASTPPLTATVVITVTAPAAPATAQAQPAAA